MNATFSTRVFTRTGAIGAALGIGLVASPGAALASETQGSPSVATAVVKVDTSVRGLSTGVAVPSDGRRAVRAYRSSTASEPAFAHAAGYWGGH